MLLAIDPGTTHSGWVLMNNGIPTSSGECANEEVFHLMQYAGVVAIERVVSYGMAIGNETILTVEWIGRFYQAALPRKVHLIPRKDICKHVCNDGRAKDKNIRQALLDRWGGKAEAVGTVKKMGPLYRIKGHAWSALAVGVTAHELHGG